MRRAVRDDVGRGHDLRDVASVAGEGHGRSDAELVGQAPEPRRVPLGGGGRRALRPRSRNVRRGTRRAPSERLGSAPRGLSARPTSPPGPRTRRDRPGRARRRTAAPCRSGRNADGSGPGSWMTDTFGVSTPWRSEYLLLDRGRDGDDLAGQPRDDPWEAPFSAAYGHDEMSARTCQTHGTPAILAAIPPYTSRISFTCTSATRSRRMILASRRALRDRLHDVARIAADRSPALRSRQRQRVDAARVRSHPPDLSRPAPWTERESADSPSSRSRFPCRTGSGARPLCRSASAEVYRTFGCGGSAHRSPSRVRPTSYLVASSR